MPVPVLMYHNITNENRVSNRYTLDLRSWEKQMLYLFDNGYRSLSVAEYVDAIKFGNKNLPAKGIVITFDDSYVSYYKHILPLLKKYNLKANFFITTDYIGKGGEWLDWQHLIELRDYGMSIQGHTHSHRFLDDLSIKEIMIELDRSKSLLEDKLGTRVEFFSCPGGRYNKKVIEVAKGLGYKGMFTSIPGFNFSENGNFLLLKRFLVTNNLSTENFVELLNLNNKRIFGRKTSYYFKYFFKKLLGNRLYYFIWRKVLNNER